MTNINKLSKSGFFQDARGNDSSSRLIGFICVMAGVFAGGVLTYIKYKQPEADILIMATAGGLAFTTISGPALAFLFFQRKTESKEEKDSLQK